MSYSVFCLWFPELLISVDFCKFLYLYWIKPKCWLLSQLFKKKVTPVTEWVIEGLTYKKERIRGPCRMRIYNTFFRCWILPPGSYAPPPPCHKKYRGKISTRCFIFIFWKERVYQLPCFYLSTLRLSRSGFPLMYISGILSFHGKTQDTLCFIYL